MTKDAGSRLKAERAPAKPKPNQAKEKDDKQPSMAIARKEDVFDRNHCDACSNDWLNHI